jgi:antitoxin component of RelBE/YafQ-DinJ toxin-antitoxin module
MIKERSLTVRMSESLHRGARVKAAELGIPVSRVVRGLLRKWVEGEIDTPTPEEGRREES